MTLAWFAVLWGIAYLLTSSVIFQPYRALGVALADRVPGGGYLFVMIYCVSCTGAWVALCLHQLAPWPLPEVIYAPIDAMVASSGLLYVVGSQWPSNIFETEQGYRYDPPSETENE